MSGPQQISPLPIGPKKDRFTPEMRILVASLLSMGVILLWAKYFGPKPPATLPTQAPAAQTASATPGAAYQPNSAVPSSTPHGTATAASQATASPISQKADSQERTIVIENDLYRVEISNRGAVVKSWQLKKYLDDSKPQRVLDVVHPKTSEQTGGWPFSLALDDPQMEGAANGALYQISSASNSLSAPADAEFSWSDGRLEVTKHFYFDHTYVVRVETSVKYNGAPVTAGLAWRGGFGDLTVTNPIPVETVTTYYGEGGKLSSFAYKKLDGPEKWGGTWQGGKDFVGIADRYFTAAFLPANGAAPGTLETRYWRVFHSIQVDGKESSEAVPEVATASRSQQPQTLRVFVGPKDYDDLKKMNPPLHALVQFGWMEFIADPLFHLLKWLHVYIPNWGWTIVVLTLVINMLLFPLRITSYKTTMKMQRAAPEIKAIQDRYKKYKMNDPRKAEMNKEVMAVYSREGINPLGSCFQMFLQMPIWFGLNTALRYAIELRHARWFGWITDLSAKDPFYILPVVVGVTMYLVSKMTPMTSTDPQQQQMMKLMPISFAVMFVVFPFSSGLALYILTSSLVGIGQQWYLNRAHPMTAPTKPVRGKK
ncbi:MAG: membrane protein insertase YidC [Candidatus Acidiferrum sp.]